MSTKTSLDGTWELSFTHPITNEKITSSVSVPSNIEPHLKELGLISDYMPTEDPFATQIFEAVDDWTYSIQFDAPDLREGYVRDLVFEGIDTIAEIYLNGEKLLSCQNMHLTYRANVTDLLLPHNTLKVVIKSSELWAREHLHDMMSVPREGMSEYDSQSHLRKARHQWGWDNAPRLLTSGIIRSVNLEDIPTERFDEVYIYTESINEQFVVFSATWKYVTPSKLFTDYSLRLTLLDGENAVYTDTRKALFVQGTFRCPIPRESVELWWPADMGEAKLYTVRLEMLKGETVCSTYESKFGIRTVTLDRTDDRTTQNRGNFEFIVNGIRTFIRGTNWKPLDALASIADKKTKELTALRETVLLNCNAVRIWGGGIYEDDAFFDFCDEHGLLIWQDFMLGCEIPASDYEYCAEISKEAEFIIKKYRNHPSLALWCGDNENDQALSWTMLHSTALPSDIRVSRDILRKAVLAHDPFRYYVASSPVASDENFTDRRNGTTDNFHTQTEKHFYCEMTEQKRELRKNLSYFLGETGPFWGNAITPSDAIFERERNRMERIWSLEPIEIPPVRIKTIFHQDDYYARRWLNSCKSAIAKYFHEDFEFERFKDFTLANNVICAEVFKDIIEYSRAVRPEKTGVIWWSLMDMWPMLFNYSVIDSDGLRKLAWYWIQKSQQPLNLMCVKTDLDEGFGLYAANEFLSDASFEYTVTAYSKDLSFEVISSGNATQCANSVSKIADIPDLDEPKMLIIEWKCGEQRFINHAFSEFADYETAKKWVELLEGLYAPDGSFAELDWLKNK